MWMNMMAIIMRLTIDYILAYLQPNFQVNLYLSVQYD